jgi:hypothetical protein
MASLFAQTEDQRTHDLPSAQTDGAAHDSPSVAKCEFDTGFPRNSKHLKWNFHESGIASAHFQHRALRRQFPGSGPLAAIDERCIRGIAQYRPHQCRG